MVHFLFWPFSNQEMILPMNFDCGRLKIEVRETLFSVFAGKFNRSCRAYILQKRWVELFSNQNSAYLENFFEFTFNTPRPAWKDVYRQKSTENASNIILLAESVVFSYVAKWSERLRGVQAVRVQASIEPNFFSVVFVCLIFAFFFSWYVFP